MVDWIAGFILDVVGGHFLWGTGAVLVRVFTLNRCDPKQMGQNPVFILGLSFWVVVVLFVCRQII